MTTGITAPFTSWHNFFQVNTELSKLQKIYIASRKLMSIFKQMESSDVEKWNDQISKGAFLDDGSLGENISRPHLLNPQLPCTDGLSFHWQPKLGEVSWGLTASVPFMGNWIPEKTEITQLLKISMFAWPGGSLRMVRWTLRSGAASQTTSPPASVFISTLTGCSL